MTPSDDPFLTPDEVPILLDTKNTQLDSWAKYRLNLDFFVFNGSRRYLQQDVMDFAKTCGLAADPIKNKLPRHYSLKAELTPRELASWLRITKKTMSNWRIDGCGPRSEKQDNGEIRYQLADVAGWIQANRRPAVRQNFAVAPGIARAS